MTNSSFIRRASFVMELVLSASLLGCENSSSSGTCQGPECVVPSDPCPDRNPLRNLYVGELHVHSSLSFDAEFAGVISEPRDAYRFARGEALEIPPFEPASARRTTQLRRPLDFAAVTCAPRPVLMATTPNSAKSGGSKLPWRKMRR
jgi:hypothetical protein